MFKLVRQGGDCRAFEQAAIETGLPSATFPADCPWTFDGLLAFNPRNND